MGAGAGLRRAEGAPGPAAGDQAGAPAERDAGGGDPGGLRAVAGPFRGPVADVRGGGDGRAGYRPALVPGVLPDPQMPPAGMSQLDAGGIRAMVSRTTLGDAAGT